MADDSFSKNALFLVALAALGFYAFRRGGGRGAARGGCGCARCVGGTGAGWGGGAGGGEYRATVYEQPEADLRPDEPIAKSARRLFDKHQGIEAFV